MNSFIHLKLIGKLKYLNQEGRNGIRENSIATRVVGVVGTTTRVAIGFFDFLQELYIFSCDL